VANPNWSLGRIGKKRWETIQNIEKSLTFDPRLGRGKFFKIAQSIETVWSSNLRPKLDSKLIIL
jgi:hypothetical protein